MNIEKIICSLLMNNIIEFNNYKVTDKMFSNPYYKNYIIHFIQHSNVKTTDELNQIFLSKNPAAEDTFFSKDYLLSQLEMFKVETYIQLLYKKTIEYIFQEKMNLLNNSITDNNAIEEINLTLVELNDLTNELAVKKEKEKLTDTYREFLASSVSKQEESDNSMGVVGLSAGLMAVDMITKGYKNSEYVIIAGRPSMGKTSKALDTIAENIRLGKNCIFHSLEMPREQILARLLPKINRNLNLDNTLYGIDYNNKKEEIEIALNIVEESNLLIEDYADSAGATMNDIEKVTNDYIKEFGHVDLVSIDYIQLLKPLVRSNDENVIITDNSRRISLYRKKTGAPWLVLSQLSRSLETRPDKRPLNSDLRSSGSLEQDADLIIFPYRPNVYMEKELREKLSKKPDNQALQDTLDNLKESEIESSEIIISKNRNGPLGTASVQFHKSSASYINIGEMDLYGEDIDFS